jgi:hypothetical protein
MFTVDPHAKLSRALTAGKLPLRLWPELEEKGKAKMKKSAFAVAATACIFVAGGARADDGQVQSF